MAGNLAYFQPATQSATYVFGDSVWAADLANDGYLTTASYAVDGGVPGWWQVDLLYECIVYNITVYAPVTSEYAMYMCIHL